MLQNFFIKHFSFYIIWEPCYSLFKKYPIFDNFVYVLITPPSTFYKILCIQRLLRTFLFTFYKILCIQILLRTCLLTFYKLLCIQGLLRTFLFTFYKILCMHGLLRTFPPTFWKRLCNCIFLGIVHWPPSTELCTGAFGSVEIPPPASLYTFCEIYSYREIGDISGNR